MNKMHVRLNAKEIGYLGTYNPTFDPTLHFEQSFLLQMLIEVQENSLTLKKT